MNGQTKIGNKCVKTHLHRFCSKHPSRVRLSFGITTFHISIVILPFQAVNLLPHPLLSYGEIKTTNSTLDQQLMVCDMALDILKGHL